MATKNPLKNIKVKIINIVLYPEEMQKMQNYIDIFQSIYENKITICTYGDRYTRIRSFYPSTNGELIHGSFANSIFFDPKDKALDSKTNEIIPADADPNKGLGLKTWDYFFFPKYHRLVFLEKEGSESQILKFLEAAFNNFMDSDNYQINTEKDSEIIDRIVNAQALTKLKVVVSYSNNDNLKGWKAMIDKELRKSNSKTAILDLSATKKSPIDVTQSDMIGGFVQLSASNGFVEASEIDENGKINNIKTIDHPMIRNIQYVDDPIPQMENLVKSIANSGTQSSE